MTLCGKSGRQKFFFQVSKCENQMFFYSRVNVKKNYSLLIFTHAQIRALDPTGITQAWVYVMRLPICSTGLVWLPSLVLQNWIYQTKTKIFMTLKYTSKSKTDQ